MGVRSGKRNCYLMASLLVLLSKAVSTIELRYVNRHNDVQLYESSRFELLGKRLSGQNVTLDLEDQQYVFHYHERFVSRLCKAGRGK